ERGPSPRRSSERPVDLEGRVLPALALVGRALELLRAELDPVGGLDRPGSPRGLVAQARRSSLRPVLVPGREVVLVHPAVGTAPAPLERGAGRALEAGAHVPRDPPRPLAELERGPDVARPVELPAQRGAPEPIAGPGAVAPRVALGLVVRDA